MSLISRRSLNKTFTNDGLRGASLELESVSKTYGPSTAVYPTSLQVPSGEFFALIGPSGSGKSTLLGMIAGFVPPSQGAIRINGCDIVSIPPYRRNIGMVFQNYALFPHMTVAENVAFPLRMRAMGGAETARRVSQMLALVRLDGYGGRRPTQLSGGQQQRVALARAAVYNPGLLLMDEPLGALDKNLREEMQEEIKRFQSELGATVIYVTHDQQEAASMADRIAILRAGRVEQLGSPKALYEAPANRFVASFLGEANLLHVESVTRISEGCLEVRTPDGLVTLVRDHGRHHATATKAGLTLCVRPENVRLGMPVDGGENVFSAAVQDATYLAGSIRYRLRISEATVLTARVPLRTGTEAFAAGESISVQWSPDDGVILGEE
jgi:putative spermidine/putrescine transport system ATP-binding protein